MTLDVMERPAPALIRLPSRSAIATANVELARRTLAELTEPTRGLDDAGARVMATLRRLVARDEDR